MCKHKNDRRFSWVTSTRVLSLAGSHSPPQYLGCEPTLLISGPAVGTTQILIWPYSSVSLPPVSTAIRTSAVSLAGALSGLYMFHVHRVGLVDPVDLICTLCSWWEVSGSSSLLTLPLGFNCGVIPTSACGSSTGVCSWGRPGGLGFAPVRARCGGGAATWVAGVLAAPGTRGSWQLGQQEIECSRRVWQPVLAKTFQDSCLEKPPPWQTSLAGHSLQGHKESDTAEATRHAQIQEFSCLWQLCPRESWAWRWQSCLACGDPGSSECAGTQTASTAAVMALSESYFECLVASDQKPSLASLSP